MTIQDNIIQALEASYSAHRMALARIDMLASERPGFVGRIAELETEIGALRSQIAHSEAEEAASLTSIQSLIANLAQAVEKTKSVLAEPPSAPTSPPESLTGRPHQISAPPEPGETDMQASALDALAEPAERADGPDAGSPALHADENPVHSEPVPEEKIHLRGSLDFVTKDVIWGWVQDVDNQMEQVTVLIKYEGHEIDRTIANSFRKDLHEDGIGDGCYGYSFNLENHPWLRDRHRLELVYLIGDIEIRAPDEKMKDLLIEPEPPKEAASGR